MEKKLYHLVFFYILPITKNIIHSHKNSQLKPFVQYINITIRIARSKNSIIFKSFYIMLLKSEDFHRDSVHWTNQYCLWNVFKTFLSIYSISSQNLSWNVVQNVCYYEDCSWISYYTTIICYLLLFHLRSLLYKTHLLF